MPRMQRSTKKPTAPPSRAVLERRKDEFKWESRHLRTVSVRDVVTLHTRLCQAIAFSLWMDGEVDPTRAKILKLLADAIEGGNGQRTGWRSKDGVPINLADLDGAR
jgi:hypothetical protein